MTQQLEDRLDQILDMHGQHLLQQEAGPALGAHAPRAEPGQEQTIFSSDIRALIREAVDRANRHLAMRRERY
jgi:hypothetical protein